MKTRLAAGTCALGLFALGLVLCTNSVEAAMDVVLTASPREATVGQPVELLIRTFLPFGTGDLELDVAAPRTPFPAPSGYWNVLYAFASDYPFDVEGRGPGGESVRVVVSRDPNDASLYRGIVRPPSPGRWRFQILNYSDDAPGTWAEVDVAAEATAPVTTTSGQTAPPDALATLAMGGVLGAAAGFLIGRRRVATLVSRP